MGEDLASKAHALIDLAKNASWDELYKSLDSQRELVNVRPDVREYSVLHQAAYHGAEEAVNILIEKYDADPMLPTKSGELIVDVAKQNSHTHVAKALEARMKEARVFVAPSEPKKLRSS